MQGKKIFIKVSGSLINNPRFYHFMASMGDPKAVKIVLCVGGGEQINENLKKAGYNVSGTFGPAGREQENAKAKAITYQTLITNKQIVERELLKRHCAPPLYMCIPPIIHIGEELCFVNGDNMVVAAYLGYDLLFVATLKERFDAKSEQFKDYRKVQIVGF